MATCPVRILVRGVNVVTALRNNFSTSAFRYNKWRTSMGLEKNPNSYGPLQMLPDYSFVDGRPVPLSKNKKKKLELQKEYCETIKKYSAELDEELKNYNDFKAKEAAERAAFLASKLKPKGEALLKPAEKSTRRKT